jgi:hypothetical protein
MVLLLKTKCHSSLKSYYQYMLGIWQILHFNFELGNLETPCGMKQNKSLKDQNLKSIAYTPCSYQIQEAKETCFNISPWGWQ